MNENRYVTPGYFAIIAAALTLPMVVLGLILDILARKNQGMAAPFLLPYLLVLGAQTVCGLYALGRLKTFLNERHGFHDVDGLIVAIIIGACLMTLIGVAGRVSAVVFGVSPRMALTFVPFLLVVGLPLSVLGIVFSLRLLRLGSDLGGMLRPFVYLNIAGAVCFATLILAPLGLLLDAAGNVVLGMIFLRKESTPATPEFV